MKDIEQAKIFLMMAKKDYLALTGMTNEEKFVIEIFGFHVQQTALFANAFILGIDSDR